VKRNGVGGRGVYGNRFCNGLGTRGIGGDATTQHL